MAAETAVEITAQETALTEDRQAKAEHSEATVQEDHSERALTVREDHLEKAQKDHVDHSVKVQKDHADHSVKTASVQEEASAKVQREDHSETESHSAVTDHVVHSARAATEETADSEAPARGA